MVPNTYYFKWKALYNNDGSSFESNYLTIEIADTQSPLITVNTIDDTFTPLQNGKVTIDVTFEDRNYYISLTDDSATYEIVHIEEKGGGSLIVDKSPILKNSNTNINLIVGTNEIDPGDYTIEISNDSFRDNSNNFVDINSKKIIIQPTIDDLDDIDNSNLINAIDLSSKINFSPYNISDLQIVISSGSSYVSSIAMLDNIGTMQVEFNSL